MPTTGVYNLPYPDGEDLPNGPGQIQALAEAVETTLQADLALGGDLTVPGQLTVAGEAVPVDSLTAGVCIKRVTRLTASTPASGSQGVLRLDGVPLQADRRYEVRTNTLLMLSTVANDRGSARLSHTTDGSVATVDSQILAIGNGPAMPTASDGAAIPPLVAVLHPTVDMSLSVLLFTSRISGTGNVRAFIVSSTAMSIDLSVYDCGPAPASSGTII